MTVLGGGEVAEGFVMAVFVVLDHPPPGRFPNVVDPGEEVSVEHLLAEDAVESIDGGVLVGLSRRDLPDWPCLAVWLSARISP